ncbi:MAG TPA: CoA pyrophosphatase [Cellvibrio sp.]|nr:CoA pyrophosphatase [Cellvibrio sp.]
MSRAMFNGLTQQLIHEPLDVVLQPQAAVIALISEGNNPSILYTKRAAHLRQHPGEVCFPGGMWEQGDSDLWATALREAHEEIGLPAFGIQLLGRLPQSRTRAGTPVTPFVASFDSSLPLHASPDELDSIFLVPLSAFKEGIQVREDTFERNGLMYQVPVYQFQGYEIWGVTAAVTAQVLKLWDRAAR